jgi:hypothetical protein
MMQLDVPEVRRVVKSTLAELVEGWTYVAESVPIRTILLLFAAVSLMGMPFVVLMPVFAAKVLNGGPHTLGFLMGAMGVGALVSALSLAARKSVRGLIRMIPMAAGVFGIGLIGFGLSHVFWLSMITVMVAGGGMMQGMAASNTIIQTLVTEDKRGRVMSYYTMAFVGMAPFGSLLAGTMAHAAVDRGRSAAHRRAVDGHHQRRSGSCGRGMVLHAAACSSSNRPANLPRAWHHSRGEENGSGTSAVVIGSLQLSVLGRQLDHSTNRSKAEH